MKSSLHVEGATISLARIIKASHQIDRDRVKKIALHSLPAVAQDDEWDEPSMDEVFQRAKQIIKEAEEKATVLLKENEQMIRAKRRELEKEEKKLESKVQAAMEQARESGYQAGYEDGRRHGEEAVQEHIEKARAIVEQSRADYLQKLKEAEPEIVSIAFKIAGKVIGKAVEQERGYWTSLIKTALHEVKDYDDIRIFVHPHNYEEVVQKKNELLAIVNHSTDIYIVPDQELAKEGCFIETSFGTIDASVDSQLNEIKTQLLEHIGERET